MNRNDTIVVIAITAGIVLLILGGFYIANFAQVNCVQAGGTWGNIGSHVDYIQICPNGNNCGSYPILIPDYGCRK